MKPNDLVTRARMYAIRAHKDTRYGDLPYHYHLQEVVSYMGEVPEFALAAAWLHDAVEDTPTTLHDIREEFGGNVARLVDCVTDEPGKNRKERKAGMYRKLACGPALARRIKLADRVANTKASIENPGMRAMYAKEFPEFIRIAGTDDENKDLVLQLFWLNLDAAEAGG